MKQIATVMILSFVTLGLPLSSYAQCSQLQGQTISCTGPNDCKQSIPVNLPQPAQYGWYLSYFIAVCCTTQVATYTYDSGCEGTGYERAPIQKAKLAELANHQSILIANCGGGYDPFQKVSIKLFTLQDSLDTRAKLSSLN